VWWYEIQELGRWFMFGLEVALKILHRAHTLAVLLFTNIGKLLADFLV
jgi:hypothetical protein